LVELGRFDEAKRSIEQACRLENSALNLHEMVVIMKKLRDWEKSEGHLAKQVSSRLLLAVGDDDVVVADNNNNN